MRLDASNGETAKVLTALGLQTNEDEFIAKIPILKGGRFFSADDVPEVILPTEVAAALKLTAPDLIELGIVDRIVPEPAGGAHIDFDTAAELLGGTLEDELAALAGRDVEELVEARYEKFRSMGRDAVTPA